MRFFILSNYYFFFILLIDFVRCPLILLLNGLEVFSIYNLMHLQDVLGITCLLFAILSCSFVTEILLLIVFF